MGSSLSLSILSFVILQPLKLEAALLLVRVGSRIEVARTNVRGGSKDGFSVPKQVRLHAYGKKSDPERLSF